MSERLDPLILPLWGSRLIEASAGTGKTWTIAALYLRLVLGHGDAASAFASALTPPQILVMTFTRAATRELSDRIRKRLVEAAAGFRDPRTVDAEDTLLIGLIDAYPEGAARAQAAWRLSMAAEGMDDAAVFTIDAWVQRMLREHAFDSGCLFDEEVQPDETAMLAEAARDYWRREVYPLNADAQDAVLSVWGDVRALVGDARRLVPLFDAEAAHETLGDVWRIASRAQASELATLKAEWPAYIAQMRAWIDEGLAAKDSPFNGHRLQRRWVDGWLQLLERWAVTADQVEPMLPDTALHRLSRAGVEQSFKPGRSIAIPDVFDALPRLVDSLRSVTAPAHAMRRHAAAHIAAGLRMQKERAGVYGFNDMLERLDVALHGPSGERLRERIVGQYPVALIDEFQDTSSLQYRIFERLYRTADNDRATALLLIGDPKQSIYAFRGADIRSYLRARAAMAGRHYVLGTNYRSTAALVAVVNRLFERGESTTGRAFRFGPEGDALPFLPVDARGRLDRLVDSHGPVAVLTLRHDATLSPKALAQHHFAEHCAEHIATSLNDPQSGFVEDGKSFRRLEPADITVLVRTRREAVAIRRALRHRRIASVYLSDQDSVFASDEARDLLHWLRAVSDPQDSRRARIAFATSLAGLSLADIARLSHDDVAFEQRLDELRMLNNDWRRQGVLTMLRRTLHVLGLPARWLREPDGERRLTNVLHLAELLQAASANLDGEQAVIRWLAERLDSQAKGSDDQIVRLESEADLVRVLTIHMAKGLEYPIVYVPFACSQRDPDWKAGQVAVLADDDGDRSVVFTLTDHIKARELLEVQQEDVRLLYVALTRARHALWLGVAAMKAGKSQQCGFDRSAFGYLAGAGQPVTEDGIVACLRETFGPLPAVDLAAVSAPADVTRLLLPGAPPTLRDAPIYTASFERDWTIGSFSSLVRDLSRLPISAAMVDPAVEEEVLAGPVNEQPAPPSSAARHRFPRGALAGNFLHDQLEWLAEQRFALKTDARVRDQLLRRCERQGWGHRAHDVAVWMTEVVATSLPPVGCALDRLQRLLPEMEFWFPSAGIDAQRIDRLCRTHLLGGRERPALPDRTLRGMLMGFADLVFEVDGRYWVLDYKSNALGAGDEAYTREALERSMAEHRYDVQAAIYLLALHRLLRQRLGARYDPAQHLGGALYLFLRGIEGPERGCYVVEPDLAWLDALDIALSRDAVTSA